jgi:hypothetical protein
MTTIYKSDEGARAVRERYLEILKRWPVPNEQMRVPTRQGETFVIACGEKTAMPLLLFHGSAGNSAMTAAHRKEGNVYLDRVEVLIHS